MATATPGPATGGATATPATPKPTSSATLATTNVGKPNLSLLKTATIYIIGHNGKKRALCLIDDGAQNTFVREAVAKELGLTTIEDQTMAIRSFGAAAPLTKTLKVTSLELRGTAPNAKSIIISGLVTESITVAQPYLQTEYADLLRRSGKWLADDRALTEDSRELEVDVLIGMDYLWQVCHSTVKTSNCGLRAIKSIFGWLITGVTKSSEAGEKRIQLQLRC